MKKLITLLACFLSFSLSAQTVNRYYQLQPYDSSITSGSCGIITPTPDNGLIVSLTSWAPGLDLWGGPGYVHVMKTDDQLTPEWKRNLHGNGGRTQQILLGDGSVVYYSYFYYGVLIEKVNSLGDLIWQRWYKNGDQNNLYISSAVYANSKITFAGSTNEVTFFNPDVHPALVEIDTAGNILSVDSFSLPMLYDPSIRAIAADDTGNYFVSGNDGGYAFVAKLSPTHAVLWCKQLTLPMWPNSSPRVTDLIALANGDIVLGGANSYNNNEQFIMRVSSTGNVVWARGRNDNKILNALQQLNNGNILATFKNCITVFDLNGQVVWTRQYGPDEYGGWVSIGPAYEKTTNEYYFTALRVKPYTMRVFNTDSLGIGACDTMTDTFTYIMNPTQMALTSSSCTISGNDVITEVPQGSDIDTPTYIDTCVVPNQIPMIAGAIAPCSVYPNPSDGNVTVETLEPGELILYDITGKTLGKYLMSKGKNKLAFPTELSPGNYILHYTDSTSRQQYNIKITIDP